MRRTARQIVLGALLVAPSVARADGPSALAALDQRMGDIERQVRELDIQLAPPGSPRDAVERRLIDGQVLYELKNYEQASIVFLDVVEKYPKDRFYPDALYYLADSLYLNRDYLSARRFFQQLVDLGPSKHYADGLQRLIELALHTGNYDDVEGWLQKLAALPPSENTSVSYVKGKYYYFRGRYDDAVAALSQIAQGHPYWFQAQYFIGAARVAQLRPTDALPIFDEIVKIGEKDAAESAETKKTKKKKNEDSAVDAFALSDEGRVLQLSHLALGRIYYDQGQLAPAAKEYAQIAKSSDLYPQALYEDAWVAIKAQQYDRAYRQLDLLLTAVPEGPQVPEIKLLLGNLHIRDQEWGAATESFSKTRDQFETVKKDLDESLSRQGDSQQFFRELIAKNLGKFDLAAYLPASAVKWVDTDPSVARLSSILGDIADLHQSLDDAEDVLRRVDRAMKGPERVNIFPELAQARTRSAEAMNAVLDVENKLVRTERQLVDSVAGAERAHIDEVQAERQRLEQALVDLPKGNDGYQRRIKEARSSFDALDRQLAELNVTLRSFHAERVAIEKYSTDTEKDADPRTLAMVRQQLGEARGAEEEANRRYEQLRGDVADATQGVGVDDSQMQREEQLKQQLASVTAQEHQLLGTLRDRLDGDARVQADHVEAILARAQAAQAQIQGFNGRIESAIDDRLRDIKVTIAEEKAHLVEHEQSLAGCHGDAVEVGGGVAAESYRNIANHFYQVVVRADVGIIDVAWALKQNKTDEDTQLVREKSRDLRVLENGYKEALKE